MLNINFLTKTRWLVTIILLLFLGITNVWGTDEVAHSLSFPDEKSSSNGCTSYTGTWTATNDETSAKSWSIYGFVNNSWNDSWAKIRAGAKKSKKGDAAKRGTSTITTSGAFSEAITQVVVSTVSCQATADRYLTATKLTLASDASFTQNVVEYSGPITATENTMTFTVSTPTASRYYKLSFSWYNNTTTAGVIEISQIDYYTAVASCSGNASASSASASTNSSFTLTSLTSAVAASTTGWSVGSGCAWTDYGFVWSDGANTTTPTLESNGTASSNCTKVPIGSSGTVTEWATSTSPKIISQTWVVGHTYYIRAYGKNGYASATYQYTDATSFTLRSVTFDSNGGSSVDTWYVKSGGSYSEPTAPTKTGYNFGGWYTDNGTFESAVSWPATISSNQTYYAKWTAKTSTVTLDKNGATSGSNQTVTATYGSAMPTTTTSSAALAAPTKTAHTLLGYWDTDASTGGNKYYNNDMTSAATWDKETATATLYARWEAKVDQFIDDMHGTTGYTSGSPHEESGAGYTMPGPLSENTGGNDCESAHYTFVGWVTAGGQNDDGTIKGSPKIWQPGESNNASNATYYAVWAEE